MRPAHRLRLLLIAVLPQLLLACATGRSVLDDLPVREYSGHYRAPAGESWFQPCDAAVDAAPMWVTFTDASVAQRDAYRAASVADPAEPVFVRWRAALTTGGEVGPGGPGTPALLVREILEIRPAAVGDCGGGVQGPSDPR